MANLEWHIFDLKNFKNWQKSLLCPLPLNFFKNLRFIFLCHLDWILKSHLRNIWQMIIFVKLCEFVLAQCFPFRVKNFPIQDSIFNWKNTYRRKGVREIKKTSVSKRQSVTVLTFSIIPNILWELNYEFWALAENLNFSEILKILQYSTILKFHSQTMLKEL